uniref:Rho-GAP domain-containing protein n=1 Tax=Strongyloides venezuelensis TaxID=75913 RepID=A0A0K0EYL6_STRVS
MSSKFKEQPTFCSTNEIIQLFKDNSQEAEEVCYKLYSNEDRNVIIEVWDVLTSTYSSEYHSTRILGFTKQLHKFKILEIGKYDNYKNLLIYYITYVSTIDDPMEVNCLDLDFIKFILSTSIKPSFQELCEYFIKNDISIQKVIPSHCLQAYQRVIKKLSDEIRGKEQYQYGTKLRDDRLIYNEIYTLYYHALNEKNPEFDESLKSIEEQVQKHPESISKQMYLLSYIASQCLGVPARRIRGLNLFKRLLSFILELVLGAEKNSTDNSVSKRIVCVVTPYLQFISNSEKVIGYGDIFSRLVKVLVFLNTINTSEFNNLFNNNYIAFKNLAESYPGSWIPYLLGKNNFRSKFKGPSNYGPYKDSFDDSILDSLYEPALNGFDVKGFKLKDSYGIYETMKTFRGELEEEMKHSLE